MESYNHIRITIADNIDLTELVTNAQLNTEVFNEIRLANSAPAMARLLISAAAIMEVLAQLQDFKPELLPLVDEIRDILKGVYHV